MSDTIIKFIPADHTYAPNYLEARGGVEWLQKCFPAVDPEQISFTIYPNPSFIDNGENLESIHCPKCKAYVSQRWWSDAVGDAYRDDFWDLSVSMPCCLETSSLNALEYTLHVGFARFVLAMKDVPEPMPEDVVQGLSSLYGQPFRMVPVRV